MFFGSTDPDSPTKPSWRRPDSLRDFPVQDGDAGYEPTPSEVEHAENKSRLRHYEPETDAGREVPVVLAPAFINTPAILDLDAEQSVVTRFLERDFDVYLVDWGDPSRLDTALSLEDYVDRYVRDSVSVAREREDGGRPPVRVLDGCAAGGRLRVTTR